MDQHEMPEPIRESTQTVLRILQRHEITQTELARMTGYVSNYISRVLSGQYPVPADMLSALWTRTSDLDIARLIGIPDPAPPVNRSDAERLDRAQADLIHAILDASDCARSARAGTGSESSLTRALDRLAEATTQMHHACAALASAASGISAPSPAPGGGGARAIAGGGGCAPFNPHYLNRARCKPLDLRA